MRKGFADNKILFTVIVATILILICFGAFRSTGPADRTAGAGEEGTSADDKPGLIEEEEEDESDENPDEDPDEDIYTADRYALIFWDHGGGSVYGYGKDTLYKGDSLLLREMKAAVDASLFGKKKACRLDWVGFDACLMATLENAVVWKDYTDYLVASEELESGDGWDYSFLSLLNEDKDTLSLCRGIVECFQDYYLAKRSDMFHPDITLSVMDLSKTDDTVKAVNALAGRMKKDISGDLFADIVRARVSAKSFGVIGSNRGGAFAFFYDTGAGKDLTTTTLTIGPKLSFIGKNAFYGLKFHGFKVDKANPHFSSKNGLLMTKTGDVVLECPFMIGKEVVVPEGTTGLNQGVFEKCSPTAVFYLPDSLVRMSKDDFPHFADSSEEEGGITIVCSKGSAAETFAYKNGFHTAPADSEIPEDNSTYEKTVPMTDGSCHFQVYSDHAALVCYRGCDTSVAVPEYVDGKPVTEIGDGKNPVFEIDHSYDKSLGSFDENDRGGDQNETVNNPSGVLRILMPDGIKRINKNAFKNVKFDVYDDADGGILALPAELEYISPQAFGDWSSSPFTGLSISENNKNYCSIDGVLFTKDRSTLVLFPSRIQTDSSVIREKMTRSGNEYFYYIPDGVKTIGDYAFKSLPYIRTDKFLHLIFPPSLETIGNHAFEYADLYDISLNEGLKVIGKKAFMSSDLLSDRLILPDSLKEIGDEAFARAYVGLSYEDFRYGFRHIELPEHLKTVGEDVFNQYGYYDNDKTIVSCDDLYIKTDLSEMKSRAFRGLNTGAFHTDPAHPRFASPEGLLTNKEQTVLLAVPNAREGTLEIPEGIEAVEADAFGGCSKITKIVFPNTVKTISGRAFDSMGTDPVICSDEDSFAREYARLHQMEWEEK